MARTKTFDEASASRLARETFHDHGYAATSVQQLTAATGLSRSSLYDTFGDKHGLFLRSFAQYCEDNADVIEDELAGDQGGARERLQRHLRTKIDGPSSQRGCLLAKATAELGATDDDVAKTSTEFYTRYERALAACVRDAQAAGDVRDDLDAMAIAAMLLSLLRGIETLNRAGYPTTSLAFAVDTTMTMLAPAT
ncbi:TetR/AcrR family transcriptional regulator [Aeromicrobium endophyticum]|uniref:TetR/AcrR family transcriptional regulator n=1 Tax=Aeromicrobium endophyticum TaxID=2292704 RepID=A0A371P438_9ACTN|nr:TetR/AcrR family transcriptional regulator [Aeromicrobium endophyticum]REK70166.1 TetR/AcrR family transcriptional regulator [Aeromicrobium endophyticum]